MMKLMRLAKAALRKSVVDPIVCSVTDLTPITDFMEEDVFIVGYPKSGNTWFQNLVSGVVYGANPRYMPDALIQTLVPDVHYSRYYTRFRTPMFFKSHHLPRPDYRRVVYLLRDGRDVIVSYYHYLLALGSTEVTFMDIILNNEDIIPWKRWEEHVRAWLSNPYKAEMIIIKYEDLKEDPVKEVERFCSFVGLKRDFQLLDLAVEGSSFDNMRRKDMEYGRFNPRWPRNIPFIRRGQVGSYKDEMPPAALESFMAIYSDILIECGYQI